MTLAHIAGEGARAPSEELDSVMQTEKLAHFLMNTRFVKRLRLFCLIFAALLGALDSWTSRNALNAMGVSYMDMGDAIMRGDWNTAINGFWSPLYSVPLGLAMWVIRPSPKWEFAVVHLVNYLIYLCALLAFDFFLRELIRINKEYRLSSSPEGSFDTAHLPGHHVGVMPLPDFAWIALGYSLFIWSSLAVITMATTAPDLLLSVFVYLAMALTLRVRRGAGSGWSFFILGLVCGVGYLAKAPMLPLSFVFLLNAIIWFRNLRKSPLRILAAVLGFALMAGPWVAILSIHNGHFTTGEAGRLNYLWHVNQVPFFHWQGGDPRYGTPAHPTRKVFDGPSVYEFGTPLNATYPPWYDPSYWYVGAAPRFDLKQQVRAIKLNARVYLETFTYTSHVLVLIGFLILLYQSRRRWTGGLRSEWGLLLPSVAAFAMYALVHVEPRYLAPFIPPLWLGLFATLRLPARERSQRWITCTMVPVVLLVMSAVTTRSVHAFYSSARDAIRYEGSETGQRVQLQVSEALAIRGIQAGDAVGFINFEQQWIIPIVHWARLAHVSIVAELPNTQSAEFIAAPESRRREVMAAFAKTGAKAIIAARVPSGVTLPGWERIGSTDFYLLKL